jgi:hypothetical protein
LVTESSRVTPRTSDVERKRRITANYVGVL